MLIQFRSSYAGESSYVIDGVEYNVRIAAHPRIYADRETFEREIVSRIGVVMHDDSRRWDAFPPAEIVAAISERLRVPLVGGRYAPGYVVETDGDRGAAIEDGGSLYLATFLQEIRRAA